MLYPWIERGVAKDKMWYVVEREEEERKKKLKLNVLSFNRNYKMEIAREIICLTKKLGWEGEIYRYWNLKRIIIKFFHRSWQFEFGVENANLQNFDRYYNNWKKRIIWKIIENQNRWLINKIETIWKTIIILLKFKCKF